MEFATRDVRQQRILAWVRETFGEANATLDERAARFLEEALELAQAQGLALHRVRALTEHVYSKPAGSPAQEVGGISVTLLAYCQAAGISADGEELAELERVLAIDPSYFRKRHNLKADAGVAVRVDDDDTQVFSASELAGLSEKDDR